MREISDLTLGRLAQFFGKLENSKKLLLREQATLKEDVSLGIELTVKETQRHLLRMLLRRESTCREIRHLADKILLGSRGKHNWEKESFRKESR